MKIRALSLLSLISTLASLAMMPVSSHAAIRTFVGSNGNDANACTRTAPCRTFGAAIGQTDANGEVIVLDSAGYGPVTITKSVSIFAPVGIQASVSAVSGGDGITINGSSITVVLRGLTIIGQSNNGFNGINFIAGSKLFVTDCFIKDFSGNAGILHNAVNGHLFVDHTHIIASDIGIFLYIDVTAGTNSVQATITDSWLEGNAVGLYAYQGGDAVVSHTVATKNGTGFSGEGTAQGSAHLSLFDCVSSFNGTGIIADGFQNAGVVRVANCRVTRNTTSALDKINIGALISVGGNVVEDNVGNETFPTTHAQK